MTETLGYVAAILSTSAFFPQTIKTIRTKDTSGISFWMYLLFVIGIMLWFYYGILLESKPMIIANGITGVLSSVILYYKCTEKKRDQISKSIK